MPPIEGQDEVDKDAIVTDYSDAMLLPISVMTKFNNRIKELNKDKIAVLSKIMNFRRKINLVKWEAEHLFKRAQHCEEYFTDLQLFRVTRALQKILREGKLSSLKPSYTLLKGKGSYFLGTDADHMKEKLDKVAMRRDFLQNDAENKLAKMKKVCQE
jgi:hypothetical protein